MQVEIVNASELSPKTLRAQDYIGVWPHIDHEIHKARQAVERAKRRVEKLEATRAQWAQEHEARRAEKV